MASNLRVKAHLVKVNGEKETRRFALPVGSPLPNCMALLQRCFGPGEYVIRYSDPDDDEVTIRGEAEWAECLRIFQNSTTLPLRIYAETTKPKPKSPYQGEGSQTLTAVPAASQDAEQPVGGEAEIVDLVNDTTVVSIASSVSSLSFVIDNAGLSPDDVQSVTEEERPEDPAVAVENQTVEGTIAEEKTVEEKTVEEKTVEEKIVEEKTAEEKIVEEKTVPPSPLNAYDLGAQGLVLLEKGEYHEALQKFHQACEVKTLPHNVYNIACCHALLKQKAQALKYLKESVAAGYSNWRHMSQDPDLVCLRQEKEFAQIVSALRNGSRWLFRQTTVPKGSDVADTSDQSTVSDTAVPESQADTCDSSTTPPGDTAGPCQPYASSTQAMASMYRIAQVHARAGRRYQALKTLRQCLNVGGLTLQQLEGDTAFDALRNEAQFKEILAELS